MPSSYRKFKLVNGDGKEFNFTDPSYKVFADSPQGLGYSKTITSLRLGDDLLIPYSIFNLDQISFTIRFYDDKLADIYQKYNDFINFMSYKPLYLLYQKPNSFTWYRRRIETLSLGKTQVDYQNRMLSCPFTIQPLTFWEDDKANVIKISNNEQSNGKEYPITYPFSYAGKSFDNIDITTTGLLDMPLKITIDGTVTNPQYIIYDSKGTMYGTGKFIGTFDKLFINSDEAEEEIQLMRGGLIIDNPLSYQDLTIGSPNEIYVTFLKLKTGKSKLRFVLDSGFDGSVLIEWRNRYVTV